MIKRSAREAGFGMLMLIVSLTFVLTLAGAVSLVTANGLKTGSRSNARMQSFYAADAAAQVANSVVRSTGLSMQSTSYSTSIGGHAAQVDIVEEASGLYKVTSTSGVGSEEATVELWVNFETEDVEVGPQGGFEVGLGAQINLNGDLRVDLSNDARISGKDHDEDGNELADQTNGVPGLVMPDTTGDYTFNLSTQHDSEVVGEPQAVMSNAENQSDILTDITTIAQSQADVFVTGSTTVDEDSNGDFGTYDDPAFIYVNLGQNEELILNGDFEGHGFMVVDAGKNAEFEMHDNAKWNGVILVRAHGDPSTGNGPLVKLTNNALVIGALQLFLDIDGTTSNGHKQMGLDEQAQILYSSVVVDKVIYGDGPGDGIPLESVSGVTTFRA